MILKNVKNKLLLFTTHFQGEIKRWVRLFLFFFFLMKVFDTLPGSLMKLVLITPLMLLRNIVNAVFSNRPYCCGQQNDKMTGEEVCHLCINVPEYHLYTVSSKTPDIKNQSLESPWKNLYDALDFRCPQLLHLDNTSTLDQLWHLTSRLVLFWYKIHTVPTEEWF